MVQCCPWPLGECNALHIFTCAVVFIFLLINACCCISGSRLLQPAQVCDVLKGFIMVLCYFMMSYVDYSMMYHLIRGQSVIKLYIIYNMLEVQPDDTCICASAHLSSSSFSCCVVRWQTACSPLSARTYWTLCTGPPQNQRRRREHT